ncbi:MAG: family 10 glycosylhydrolase [Candidatus Sericytochromatia bacterium]|nr:family 10 glycosylhydrolase [Candidatus Tanganyikabacteria bacterium]
MVALVALAACAPQLPPVPMTPSRPGVPAAGPPGAPRQVTRPPTDPGAWRAVWLNHDLLAAGRSALGSLLDDLADAGINVVFPNAWFRGKVLYAGSAFAPQDTRFAGWDPLAAVVDEGQRRGMKVLPWLEYGVITHYNTGGDPADSGPLLAAHPDWAALDRTGRMPLYHPDHKVYFYSLSPAVPRARDLLRDLALEIASRAPVDGLQVDRIRYPARDTSYDAFSREAFKAVKGDPATLPEDDPDWVAWRRGQVSALQAAIRRGWMARFPGRTLAAAVLPSSANAAHYQDWPAWCAAGDLDVAIPMAFNASQAYVEREIGFARQAVATGGTRLVIGLAAMHAGEANLRAQVRAAVSAGAGVALWDDQWVRSHLPAVKAALAD